MSASAANAPTAGRTAETLAAASRALAQVAFQGRSFERVAALTPAAATRAIALGSLRWYWQLAPLAERLIGKQRLHPHLRALLITGLHQLEHSRHPIETTVSSAVEATRILKQRRAAGLLNALLRRYLRERDSLLAEVLQQPQAASAHPGWLLEAIRSEYPAQWSAIIEANNAPPPMTLRVDCSRVAREQYLEQLQRAGLGARAVPWRATAVVLDGPLPVEQLPGFAQGLVSVQDAGAQLAAALLGARPGERVLDACAAPGGKTGALLEATADIEVTAVDLDAGRIELIAQNLKRLRREARLIVADLRAEPAWWDGRKFDRILLDAPCSSTGVLRRHPDIRLLRRAPDLESFAATQRELLRRCLALLKPDGRLLYSTCSLLSAENDAVVETLVGQGAAQSIALAGGPEARIPWLATARGRQLLPSLEAVTDGFYYACLAVT